VTRRRPRANDTKPKEDLGRVAAAFEADFEHWRLSIPERHLTDRRPGFVEDQGWLIQFTFGRDALGEYLDYYAAHRMTDDRHNRLYVSGYRRGLAALAGMCMTSRDPEEAAKLEAAYFRRNRRVARALIKKGFDKFTMNMELHAGMEREAEED